MDLILFGIQGSGKGTQAKRLAADYRYTIFEAGGALRAMAASDTELGRMVKGYIDEGHHVPADIIMEVVKDFVSNQPADQTILFDGIPRNMDQKQPFDDLMAAAGRSFTGVEIVIPEPEAFRRIAERAAKEGRVDDADTEKVQRRIDLFYELTKPVIDSYAESDQIEVVNGEGDIDEIYSRLTTGLGLE